MLFWAISYFYQKGYNPTRDRAFALNLAVLGELVLEIALVMSLIVISVGVK